MTATIDSFVVPPVALLVASGELDIVMRHDLHTRLVELAHAECGQLRLDLCGLTFIDCVCLRELDTARRAWDLAGRGFEVVGASASVRRIAEHARYFELAGLPSSRVHNAAAQWC